MAKKEWAYDSWAKEMNCREGKGEWKGVGGIERGKWKEVGASEDNWIDNIFNRT